MFSTSRGVIEGGRTHAHGQILMEPYTYISALPGKEIRPRFIEAFNLWLKVDEADLDVIRRVVTMLHNASLLCIPTSYRDSC